jgi:hypothetical protein
VPSRGYAVQRVLQESLAIDDERRTHDSGSLPSFYFLFLQHAVALADVAVFVRQQLHAKTVLVPESAVGHAVIHADAEHDRLQPRELVFELAEVDRLDGAAGRVVAGIEIQDYVLMVPVIFETDDVEVRIGEIEPETPSKCNRIV